MTPAVWMADAGPVGAHRIVLVHGTLDRSAGLVKLSRRLAERYRVTRYDRRGYGRSVDLEPPYSVSAHLADLEAVVESDGTPVLLFGHSFGGNVALALAERRPELVAAVVTYESPMSWLATWEGGTANADFESWQRDPAAAAEGFMRRLIGDEVWAKLPASTRADRRAEGATMVAELADLRRAAPWKPDRIDAPVLALCGEFGADHHRSAMRSIADIVPQATYDEITGARHFGPNTHPGAVAERVDRFARQVFG